MLSCSGRKYLIKAKQKNEPENASEKRKKQQKTTKKNPPISACEIGITCMIRTGEI